MLSVENFWGYTWWRSYVILLLTDGIVYHSRTLIRPSKNRLDRRRTRQVDFFKDALQVLPATRTRKIRYGQNTGQRDVFIPGKLPAPAWIVVLMSASVVNTQFQTGDIAHIVTATVSGDTWCRWLQFMVRMCQDVKSIDDWQAERTALSRDPHQPIHSFVHLLYQRHALYIYDVCRRSVEINIRIHPHAHCIGARQRQIINSFTASCSKLLLFKGFSAILV